MIQYKTIKQDLLKSVFSTVGKVLVERTEHHKKTGTVYQHKHWVRPQDVEKTDKVIGGFQNLPDNHPHSLHKDVLNSKFSHEGIPSQTLSDKLGKPVIGLLNSKNQKYFTVGGEKKSGRQVSEMLQNTSQPKFKNIIQQTMSSSSPEQKKLYKSVGICAGDSKTEELLKKMATVKQDYIKTFWGTKNDSKQEFFDNPQYYSPDKSEDSTPDSYTEDFKTWLQTLEEEDEDTAEELNLIGMMDEFQKSGEPDTTDGFFHFLAKYVVKYKFCNSTNPIVNLSEFASGTGFNLIPYFPEIREKVAPVNSDGTVKCRMSSVDSKTYDTILEQFKKDWVGVRGGIFLGAEGTTVEGNVIKDGDTPTHIIKGIYKIEGLSYESEFNDIVDKNSQYEKDISYGKNCKLDTFYHGTSLENSQMLLGDTGGFKTEFSKIDQTMGKGVYLAESTFKSSLFMNSLVPTEIPIGALLICDASLGKCKNDDIDKIRDTELHNEHSEYDSCGTDGKKNLGGCRPEWKVTNPKAVLPKYFIEIEFCTNEE